MQAEENNKNARKKWYKIWGISELVLFLLFFICGILSKDTGIVPFLLFFILLYSAVMTSMCQKAFNHTDLAVAVIGGTIFFINVIICTLIVVAGSSIFH